MAEGRNHERGRYAVEIRGLPVHIEIDELAQILPLIDGQAGRVHVINVQTGILVFQGTLDEFRSVIPPESTALAINLPDVSKF